jgi:hypothetical protein
MRPLDLSDWTRFPRGRVRLDTAQSAIEESELNAEFKESAQEFIASGAECSPLFVLVDPDLHRNLAHDSEKAMAGDVIACRLLVIHSFVILKLKFSRILNEDREIKICSRPLNPLKMRDSLL